MFPRDASVHPGFAAQHLALRIQFPPDSFRPVQIRDKSGRPDADDSLAPGDARIHRGACAASSSVETGLKLA